MYPKGKFASEIGHFLILPKLTQNFSGIPDPMAVPFSRLLSRKVSFISNKDNRDCYKVDSSLRK